MGIKIIKGVEKKDGTKPMSEMKPLEVAEIVDDEAGWRGNIVLRTNSTIMEVIDLTGGGSIFTGHQLFIVRPLTKPITIEISND
jgi:hypothetical protein